MGDIELAKQVDLNAANTIISSNKSRLDVIEPMVKANVTYQANGYLFRSYSVYGTQTFSTTFRGFCTRLAYSGETIAGILAYFIPEFAGFNIKCAIRQDDNTEIASVIKPITTTGMQSMVFVFPTPINASIITTANFRVSIEIVEENGCRLLAGTNTPTASVTADSTHKNKYALQGYSTWYDSSLASQSVISVNILGVNNIVSVPIPAVLAQDTINWYKELILPPKIYCVVGKEMNIYFDNLVSDDYKNYSIDCVCNVGTQQNERWTFTPTDAGTWSLSISFYDAFLNLTKTATTTVIAVATTAGTGTNKTCLFIGDSTTAAGTTTGELVNLFGASDPMDITLIGTKGSGANKYEGIGGWTVGLFYSEATSPFVFSGAFNFSQYMTVNSFASVDWVFIMLGINDVFNATDDSAVDSIATINMTKLEAMITSIKAFNSNIKIGMQVTIPPSRHQDAFGANYGSGVTRWRYKRNIHRYCKKLIDQFINREANNIYLIPANVNLDTENNMNNVTVAINSRNSATMVRQSNGVHPATIGYYQIADVIYYALKNI